MIKQQSQEWFDQRKGKVTASTVGAILGSSNYKDKESLMRDMVRDYFDAEKEFTGNVATDWGNAHEDDAIAELERQAGIFVAKAEFIQSADYEWLGASPDGLTDSHSIEVKCPYNKKIFKLSERQDYYAQVQTQMYCSGKDKAYFAVWTPDEFSFEVVDYDKVFIDDMIKKAKDFYAEFLLVIKTKSKYEPYLEEKVFNMDFDSNWRSLAEKRKNLAAELADVKDKVDEINKLFIAMADKRNCKGAGVSVYNVKGRTTTDYKKAISDSGIELDLSLYEKTGKPYMVVKQK